MSRRTASVAVMAVVIAVVGVMLLTGCEVPSAIGSDQRPTPSLTELPEGPRTAVLADHDVHPVVKNPTPKLPVTVRSFDDVDVTVTDVSRIVTVDMYGTLTETVFALGLGDNVVGRDGSADFPSAANAALVTVGGHDLSAEAILDLDPTVVLTDTTIGPREVQHQLREAGIPVIFFDPTRTLDGIPQQIRDVAAALGIADAGEALVAQAESELAEAIAFSDGVAEAPRIAFLYLRGTAGVYLMGGPGSGADDIIRAVGGIDVGTDIGLERAFTPLTSEALVTAQPDVILVMSEGLVSVGGVDALLEMPGIAQTPAAASKRVIDMADTELLTFGSRSGQSVLALAKALYRPEE